LARNIYASFHIRWRTHACVNPESHLASDAIVFSSNGKEVSVSSNICAPKWYFAENTTKHVRQLVLVLPPESEVAPRVKNVVSGGPAGVAFLSATWSATVAFLDDQPPELEGPYVFAKATKVVETLRHQPVSVAFAFYRMKLGAVFQVFVQVDTPEVKSAIGDRYVAERPFDFDSADEMKMAQALISRDVFEVCFVAPGQSGPCTGYFGLQVAMPQAVRERLQKELADLVTYDKGLSGRHPKGAIDQYNRENPMEDMPVLPAPAEAIRNDTADR